MWYNLKIPSIKTFGAITLHHKPDLRLSDAVRDCVIQINNNEPQRIVCELDSIVSGLSSKAPQEENC